jgi:protein-S-isoprenylcysteine O-methyltransferase Ste14
LDQKSLAQRPNTIPWPPLILVAAVAAGFVLDLYYPAPWLPSPIFELVAVLGVMLIGAALALDVLAMIALNKAKTPVLPHRAAQNLVTSGPFSISRNPIYLGNVIGLIGLGMLLGNPYYFPLALIAGAFTQQLAIIREEAHLKAKFPASWLAYQRKVRRWI